jgi:hypothetical protein
MFRRYFSRVLFGVAALMFVVLWAWAHMTNALCDQPINTLDWVGSSDVRVVTDHRYSGASGHFDEISTVSTQQLDWLPVLEAPYNISGLYSWDFTVELDATYWGQARDLHTVNATSFTYDYDQSVSDYDSNVTTHGRL